jgi:hypothetical protein
MATVEPDLRDVWPRVLDELQVFRVAILSPMRDKPSELNAGRVACSAPRYNPEVQA